MAPRLDEKKDAEEFNEQDLWAALDADAWHLSITGDSVFTDTYKFTAIQIEAALLEGGYDAIIEAGCGTGEVLGSLNTDVACFGVDLNEQFITHCEQHHKRPGLSWHVLDILNLQEWWEKETGGKFKKPLVLCVNNTLNIMPEELRGRASSAWKTSTGRSASSIRLRATRRTGCFRKNYRGSCARAT
jgi:hypothetical protein